MKKLLVTGSRDWTDRAVVDAALLEAYLELRYYGDEVVLLHGAARGLDQIAAEIWKSHGLRDIPFPAYWALEGKAAGGIRNQRMVNEGPDLALAFPLPESRGTWDCVRRCKEAQVLTRIIRAA